MRSKLLCKVLGPAHVGPEMDELALQHKLPRADVGAGRTLPPRPVHLPLSAAPYAETLLVWCEHGLQLTIVFNQVNSNTATNLSDSENMLGQ